MGRLCESVDATSPLCVTSNMVSAAGANAAVQLAKCVVGGVKGGLG